MLGSMQGGYDFPGYDFPGYDLPGYDLPVLHALLRISDAVLRADTIDDVLELICEEARTALDAASLSIDRAESDRAVRTVVSVGDLVPGTDSELTVPVMVGDTMWGELRAIGTRGRLFTDGDARLLQTIAAHTAIAIGRAEMFSTVYRYAFEDPLTGIANRRAIDRHFAGIDWDSDYPVALLCDLDGFKRFNDRDGHPAGDELLRLVALGLSQVAATIDGAVAARLGGDEFCVLLPDATLATAQVFAMDATKAIRATVDDEVTLSWGAAAAGLTIRTGQDLLAAADAALMDAKRQGAARFSTGVSTSAVPQVLDRTDRRAGQAPRSGQLPAAIVDLLDRRPDLTVLDALEILAVQVQRVVGTAAWSISECVDGHGSVRVLRSVDSVLRRDCGLSVLTDLGPTLYDLTEYPATARALTDGSTFVAAIGMEGADPAETALLSRLGYQAVLGVGVPAGQQCYLLEFFSHVGDEDFVDIAALVQVLTSYCVSRLT